jgi:hypothetical protein
VNEPFAHRVTLRESESGGALWETPNGLSATATLAKIPTICQDKM